MGPRSLAVTALDATDLSGVAALFRAHTGRDPDLDLVSAWVEGFPSAAARQGDDLVGFVICQGFAPDVLEVANLLVDPAHRGHGAARRMLDRVEADALALGYRALIVVGSELYGTQPDVDRVVALYSHLGFGEVHRTGPSAILIKPMGRH